MDHNDPAKAIDVNSGADFHSKIKALSHHTKPLHVLYAEDSAPVRNATAKFLHAYFDHIDTAKDGAEALHIYKNFHEMMGKNYDIVITDLEMPNMDGKGLSEAVLYMNPSQQIIVISSNNDPSSFIDLINIGVKKFVTKPVDNAKLHTVIHEIWESIHQQKIQEDERTEITAYNAMLKKREEIYLQKLESSLKTLEEFNDALNESGIVSKTDPAGTITYVNDLFCTISGYARDELIGKNHRIINSGGMSPSFYTKLWNRITQGKSYKGVFKNRAKDGSTYYLESLIKPIVNVNGEITEFIAIAHDITRMMDSIQTAQNAEKAKDDFFRNISHEMRTPLNAILGLTSLLKRRSKEDKKQLEMINVIEQSSQSLNHLIESILDIQNIYNNTFELNEKEFEPHHLLNSLSETYQIKAYEKSITFFSNIDASIPASLIGDAIRLREIIAAVLDNAIKFTPKQGNVDFYATYDTETSLFICQIQDTGIGMNAKEQSTIFCITQVDGSLTRKYEGAGLGMTLAGAIVDKMEGQITIHSAPNQGSTFLIEIPLIRP